jgi:hypothetical protein
MAQCRLAVLYQALEPPTIDGLKKPKKPGGELLRKTLRVRNVGADLHKVIKTLVLTLPTF